jgi:hypothetical protein
MANKSIVSDAIGGAIGGAGSNVVDLTAKTWFQKHWSKLAIGVGALVGIILLMRMRGGSRARR